MPLTFVWEGNKPTRPAPEVIERGLRDALEYFDDPKGIKHKVVTAYIRLDKLGHNVEGVGWSANDAERLVIFRSDSQVNRYYCSYYVP